MRGRRLVAALLVLSLAAVAPRDARAQAPSNQLVDPADLPKRQANFAWDKTLLRGSFSFRDAIDAKLTAKLSSGLPQVLAMRAYVFEEGRTEPIALAVNTCRVTYDLWEEVYRVSVTGPGGERNLPTINVEGVLRRCAEARDLPIVDRTLLKKGRPHFLGVIVEVNPISEAMLQQIRQWVARPTGSTGISPGNALFGSFVSLFVRQIGTADVTLRFRTQAFVP